MNNNMQHVGLSTGKPYVYLPFFMHQNFTEWYRKCHVIYAKVSTVNSTVKELLHSVINTYSQNMCHLESIYISSLGILSMQLLLLLQINALENHLVTN